MSRFWRFLYVYGTIITINGGIKVKKIGEEELIARELGGDHYE